MFQTDQRERGHQQHCKRVAATDDERPRGGGFRVAGAPAAARDIADARGSSRGTRDHRTYAGTELLNDGNVVNQKLEIGSIEKYCVMFWLTYILRYISVMNSVEQEEVDEARKLAEEWELKYKETQRQMADLDMARRTNMDKKVKLTENVYVQYSAEG